MLPIIKAESKIHQLKETLIEFVEVVPPIIEQLKKKARSLGLWNLWIPSGYPESPGLTNLEYASLCEIMGRSILAPEACNCSAPDTGNMEVLLKYGTPEQKKKWLVPLMEGQIRSAFAMTEPAVASSDATNIETSIDKLTLANGKISYKINGRKWWISGAGDPRCKLYIVMGKTSKSENTPTHRQQSVILLPADAPGIAVIRPLNVFGYDDAPHGHCEMVFKNVIVPEENLVLGFGRGFEVVQGRLGPGRIHHCMRTIGAAERALEFHIARVTDPARKTFGKPLYAHGKVMHDIGVSRTEIESGRLLVLKAADAIDKLGAKGAMNFIGIAKFAVPSMALGVIDRAIQAHGAGGVCNDFPLAYMYASQRTLRIADGPDEVHNQQIAKHELRKSAAIQKKLIKQKLIESDLQTYFSLKKTGDIPLRESSL
ncbi:hypothetical protein HK096_006020, partial [Nowakowskiella sp. JEL0078]